MQKYFKIPLVFFALSATVGLLLRWHFVRPMDWLVYPNWLHAHSHIMFLGWVTNALYLGFVHSYVPDRWQSRYRPLFILMQVLLVGMVISFPIQGYGLFSILFSTVHTVVLVVFSFWLFADLRGRTVTTSVWNAKASLIFFLISALGPFAIGATGMFGLVQTKWYYFSVYYYLHFQYNGFFTFGVLALFFRLLEIRGIPFSRQDARLAGWLLALACVPAYFLSTLWADPGMIFNLIGFVAALMQMAFLLFFRRMIRHAGSAISGALDPFPARIFAIVLTALIAKMVLQLLSAHGEIALLAGSNRSFVMAYLHLTLIGVISLGLIAWYYESGMLIKTARPFVVLIVIGFVLTELLLVVMPSWTNLDLDRIGDPAVLIFSASIVLAMGISILPFLSKKS